MSTITAGTTSTTTFNLSGDTTGALVLKTNDTGSGGTTALTLGADQSVTFGGAVSSPYTGFKNRIINGGMAVDQRNAGASQTITAAAALAYTVDRWYAWTTGANGTTQQVAGTAPSKSALKFTGATSNTLCGIAQRIEQLNCYDLASSAVTISAYMTASTNTTITAILNGPSTTADTFGTLASPTVTQIATTTFSVTTTRTLFTWTISAATMSGFNKGLELIFKAGSGLGNAVTWTVEQVQLEAGSNATSFEYRDFGRELMLCQRYYENSYPIGVAVGTGGYYANGFGIAIGTSDLWGSTTFKVLKRATPTISIYGSGTGTANKARQSVTGTEVTCSGPAQITTLAFTDVQSSALFSTSVPNNVYDYMWTASAEL